MFALTLVRDLLSVNATAVDDGSICEVLWATSYFIKTTGSILSIRARVSAAKVDLATSLLCLISKNRIFGFYQLAQL